MTVTTTPPTTPMAPVPPSIRVAAARLPPQDRANRSGRLIGFDRETSLDEIRSQH